MRTAYKYLVALVCLSTQALCQNQTAAPWQGRSCAVVLTYDDGLNVHLTNAVPALNARKLQGTFYIADYNHSLSNNIDAWRKAAKKGHELANHTLYHPCTGNTKGREWVNPDYDLSKYTLKRVRDEISEMNVLLKAIDGRSERTFAFPCGDTKIGDSSYYTPLEKDFVCARGVKSSMPTIDRVNLNDMPCYTISGRTGEEMIALVKQAMSSHALLVFLFHGVGGEHNLNVSLEAHQMLLNFLADHKREVWTAPMLNVALQVKSFQQAMKTTGLKDYYKSYFPVGVAVSPRALKTDESNLILQEFNSMTPENAMKMGPIHPREKEYFWRDADSIAAFARRNGLKLRGHTLCWHNQTPSWLFKDSLGKKVSKEVLLQRLKDHIHTVVQRYKDVVYAWDVVNEAISDNEDEYLTTSEWLQICGEDYIAKAFQFAHEADPNAQLFYNDYNEISAVKREKIYRLVKSLKDKGVPIHGVGLQAHWAVNEPSREQLDSTLQKFAGLGVKLQITELDISIYPKEHNARERRPEDNDTSFSADKERKQLEVYKMAFELFRKYRKHITGVTFWNISDRSSWLDNFPVRNRKDYPLLFDRNLQRKKVYYALLPE